MKDLKPNMAGITDAKKESLMDDFSKNNQGNNNGRGRFAKDWAAFKSGDLHKWDHSDQWNNVQGNNPQNDLWGWGWDAPPRPAPQQRDTAMVSSVYGTPGSGINNPFDLSKIFGFWSAPQSAPAPANPFAQIRPPVLNA
jgi:hypothetical protein